MGQIRGPTLSFLSLFFGKRQASTLRLLNALNSEDRGLKVRFSLATIVFETFELILCQMLSSQGKNAPSNPYPHYLVRLVTSRHNHQKNKDLFLPTEPLKSLEKKGKTLKRTRNSSQGKNIRNSKKTKEGQGSRHLQQSPGPPGRNRKKSLRDCRFGGLCQSLARPPPCCRSLSGPKYRCPGSVPRSVSGAFGPRAPACPTSVPRVSWSGGRPLTVQGHSQDTFWTLRSPKGPANTPRDTPGTLRARRAREALVAGRRGLAIKVPETT